MAKKFKLKSMGPKQILAYIAFLIAVVWTLKFIFELTSSGVKQVTSSEKYPKLECAIIQDGNSVGSRVWDLNDIDRIFNVQVGTTDISWTSKVIKNDITGTLSHNANRQTGTYTAEMKLSNGQVFNFFGKCKSGSLEKKF